MPEPFGALALHRYANGVSLTVKCVSAAAIAAAVRARLCPRDTLVELENVNHRDWLGSVPPDLAPTLALYDPIPHPRPEP